MPKPMTRKQAEAEARRRAEATEEWQVIHISHPNNSEKRFSVLSTTDAAIAAYTLDIVECIRPGETDKVHKPWGG